MRRFLSVMVLVSLILGNTEFHQLLKLPFLIAHFTDHKSENSALSFLSFLSEHYTADRQHHGHEHKKLPFKSHECSHLTQVMIVESHQASVVFKPEFSATQPISLYEDMQPQEVHVSIWQPPQIL